MQQERELRAARNQALFRAINEDLRTINEALATITDRFTISCECADRACIDAIAIRPEDYASVRAEPRHFAVVPGHVYPDVESVVRESEQYVVVEKIATAGEVVEFLADAPDAARDSR